MNILDPRRARSEFSNFSETNRGILKDIRATWGKFSEDELSALKNKDDLVAQIVAKYSLDKGQALRDVDAVLKGRPALN